MFTCYLLRDGRGHSLANKTVVHLRTKKQQPEVVFYWSISGTFVGGYDPSLPIKISFCVSV